MAGEQLSLSCGQNRLSRVTGRRAGFAVPAVTPEGPHDLATVLGCCASHFLSHPTPGPPQPGSHSCAALDSSPILHWGSSPASATWAVGASFWPELPSFLGPQCLPGTRSGPLGGQLPLDIRVKSNRKSFLSSGITALPWLWEMLKCRLCWPSACFLGKQITQGDAQGCRQGSSL